MSTNIVYLSFILHDQPLDFYLNKKKTKICLCGNFL